MKIDKSIQSEEKEKKLSCAELCCVQAIKKEVDSLEA
jgi:hypothetical protein